MAKIPPAILEAWQDREGPIVVTTVGTDGLPNAIYATCVSTHGDTALLVANNYFKKTMANIAAGSKASVLFLTKAGKSYQVKGSVAYHTQGPVYEEMKRWNPPEHPGHGAAMVEVEAVFSGAEQLV